MNINQDHCDFDIKNKNMFENISKMNLNQDLKKKKINNKYILELEPHNSRLWNWNHHPRKSFGI